VPTPPRTPIPIPILPSTHDPRVVQVLVGASVCHWLPLLLVVPISQSVSVWVPVPIPLHIDMFRSHFGPIRTHTHPPSTPHPGHKSCPRCPLCKIFYLHIFLILILHCILFGLGDLSQPTIQPPTHRDSYSSPDNRVYDVDVVGGSGWVDGCVWVPCSGKWS